MARVVWAIVQAIFNITFGATITNEFEISIFGCHAHAKSPAF